MGHTWRRLVAATYANNVAVNVSIIMPFSFAYLITLGSKWLLWLSRKSKWGFEVEHIINSTKCWKDLKKVSLLTHPDGWANPRKPGGPRSVIRLKNFMRGNIKTGGMCVPLANIKSIIVVSTPYFSCDTFCCTCFSPRTATTFSGANTVGMLVLCSTFWMAKSLILQSRTSEGQKKFGRLHEWNHLHDTDLLVPVYGLILWCSFFRIQALECSFCCWRQQT
jgi:hypothetical protein